MKYLVYVAARDEIVPVDVEPVDETSKTTSQELLGGLIPIWHRPQVPAATVLLAVRVLLMRMKGFPFDDINSAVTQITSKYLPNQYSFLALGASPKMIKWVLKRKGYNTVAISVSKVTAEKPPTVEFIEYLKRKLQKVTNNNIVLLDFVESGESLVVIKSILAKLWLRGVVAAVALGTGTKFKPDGEFAKGIDYVVQGIPMLKSGFEANKYKAMLGRSKDMRDYATYPAPVKGGNVMEMQKRQFAEAKSLFARAAELGPLRINLIEFMEIAASASSDSDDDVDFAELKVQEADGDLSD